MKNDESTYRSGTWIAEILPPQVATAERFGEPDEQLLDAEAELVRNAATKRRKEFAAGRACAREATGGLE